MGVRHTFSRGEFGRDEREALQWVEGGGRCSPFWRVGGEGGREGPSGRFPLKYSEEEKGERMGSGRRGREGLRGGKIISVMSQREIREGGLGG